jgi:hypothetical protein
MLVKHHVTRNIDATRRSVETPKPKMIRAVAKEDALA